MFHSSLGRPVRESDKLQDEALKMEAKLRALRSQMTKEREKWQSSREYVSACALPAGRAICFVFGTLRLHDVTSRAPSLCCRSNGGSLWKSARSDRGSIRNYHNDVRKRRGAGARGKGSTARRRSPRSTRDARQPPIPAGAADSGMAPTPPRGTGQPVLRKKAPAAASSAGSSSRRPRSARRLLSRADAAKWTVPDVVKWLEVLCLSQYTDTFSQNQINGEVLLELTTEDLDFMGITVLGHRKMILKGVQTLQRAAAGEAPLTARSSAPPTFKSEDVVRG